MKKKNISTFKYGYFVYVFALVFFALFAIVYVKTLLNQYESSQPERIVEAQIEKMTAAAQDGTVWATYEFPNIEYSKFDIDTDLEKTYADLFAEGELTYSIKQGTHSEDGLVYNVIGDGSVLAEVSLREVGEPVTKLAVFTIQKWEFVSVKIVTGKADYKIDAPHDFSVTVNGIPLTSADILEDGGDNIRYAVNGVHGKPEIVIKSPDGEIAEYKTAGTLIKTVYYDYSLTLPASLDVTLNGQASEGEYLEDGTVLHDIRALKKPSVQISDRYGNTVNYEGGSELPLSYIKILASESYTVTVDGASVPASAVHLSENPDYEHFSEYVDSLPKLATYDIAVLRDGADISVYDKSGAKVEYDRTLHMLDLTVVTSDDPVPASVAAEVDVLKVAEDWSRLMSKDLAGSAYGFYNYAPNLIEGSYLYNVAWKWVNSIDITFTSIHTLLNPPFTDEKVRNFTWITDNCFSVDISFVKQMRLGDGRVMEDPMNSRFHFVKYNSTWKLVNIKEIVE